MIAVRLRGEGFRNLRELDFLPDSGVNIICGDNAQGKTNLLEAIWLFCGVKSFRGSKDAEYIAFDGDFTRLELDFYAGGREQSACITIGRDKKQVLLNGIKQPGISALSGTLRGVVFSPDHLELVKQGPRERRRLIDISLCQAFPKYGKILEGYEKILRQRAVLLRDAQNHPQVLDMLETWDASLTEYGGYITWMRDRYVGKLAAFATQAYDGICSGREKFSAHYRAGMGAFDRGADRGEITRLMAREVQRSRREDIRQGRTGVGPHRDDIEITVDGKNARAFGSQGQQRSCVLAIKLAECRILEESAGASPIVLLDDVMSELDAGRREYLLNHLSGRQVFITCCDTSAFGAMEGGKVFHMQDGLLL